MLDRQSLIVAYDSKRGEPRGKLRSVDSEDKTPRGDCVDCRRCIAVCPTGIDIRHGLQLECVHCTQCIDACDEVMVKIEKPKGLIRYSTQDGLEGKRTSLIRPRTVLYSVLLSIVTVLFFVILATKFAFDARLLPTSGAPFAFNQQGMVQNNFRVRLVNRSQQLQTYTLSIPNDDAVAHWSSENQVELAPGKSQLIPMRIEFPASKTNGTGKSSAKLSIKDETGGERQFNVQLIGPR
jgi:cytochrome c oxidase accessory protein FixG